jgi:hypothetical protein
MMGFESLQSLDVLFLNGIKIKRCIAALSNEELNPPPEYFYKEFISKTPWTKTMALKKVLRCLRALSDFLESRSGGS